MVKFTRASSEISWSTPARCSQRHTPAVAHRPKQRCAVWNRTPNHGGNSRHRQPLVSTYTIAVKTARSSIGAAPPPGGQSRNQRFGQGPQLVRHQLQGQTVSHHT